MNAKTIILSRIYDAKEEATRFLERLEKAESEIDSGEPYSPGPHFQFAAAKRSSMDLTRALANLRRSIYEEEK